MLGIFDHLFETCDVVGAPLVAIKSKYFFIVLNLLVASWANSFIEIREFLFSLFDEINDFLLVEELLVRFSSCFVVNIFHEFDFFVVNDGNWVVVPFD